MKKCPYCAEDIQDAAKVCKHCGRDLENPQVTAQQVQIVQPKKSLGCVTWGAIIFIALVSLGWCVDKMSPRTPSTSNSTSPSERGQVIKDGDHQLELKASRGYSEYGFHIVEGQVTNLTTYKVDNVQAVVTWFSADGTMITSDDALIEFNPLMPGQTSPFKTMSRTNPLMSKYSVEFKRMFGPNLPTKDSRQK